MKYQSVPSNNNIFNELNKYIIFNHNFFSPKKKEIINEKKNIQKKTIIDDYFIPNQKDKLFWCFFIVLKGMDEYNSIHKKYFQIENQFKMETISQINKNSSLLKENKIKKAATLVELANDTKISLSNLHVLCLYNRINIVYIYKQSYSILQGGEDDEPFSIIYNDYNKIKCQVNVSKDKINNIKKTFFNITNSFKSCSYYKLNELKEIAENLKIGLQNDKGKPKTKSHLYSNIQELIL